MDNAISRRAVHIVINSQIFDTEYPSELDELKRQIDALPALDVVLVVHARWIYTGEMDEDGNCEANCSHCGAGDKHRADLKDAVPYCWKCGAKMDGDSE